LESIKFRGAIATKEARLGDTEKFQVSVALLCDIALQNMQYKYCIAYVALLFWHWIALQQRNALLCSRSVQLQQNLDFSLGGEVRCNRDHCWH